MRRFLARACIAVAVVKVLQALMFFAEEMTPEVTFSTCDVSEWDSMANKAGEVVQ